MDGHFDASALRRAYHESITTLFDGILCCRQRCNEGTSIEISFERQYMCCWNLVPEHDTSDECLHIKPATSQTLGQKACTQQVRHQHEKGYSGREPLGKQGAHRGRKS